MGKEDSKQGTRQEGSLYGCGSGDQGTRSKLAGDASPWMPQDQDQGSRSKEKKSSKTDTTLKRETIRPKNNLPLNVYLDELGLLLRGTTHRKGFLKSVVV